MYIMISVVILSMLVGIGIITVIDWIMPLVNRPKAGMFSYCILPLKNNPLELEQILRYGYSSVLWDRWLKGGQLVVLDLGLERQGREVCEAFCGCREDILLVRPEELTKALLGDSTE